MPGYSLLFWYGNLEIKDMACFTMFPFDSAVPYSRLHLNSQEVWNTDENSNWSITVYVNSDEKFYEQQQKKQSGVVGM